MDRSSITAADPRMIDVEENYRLITERMAEAALRSGRRPEDIELVAVTKTVPVEYINHSIALGVRHVGENRVQELSSKFDSLLRPEGGLKISVIGHLQTNKARKAVSMADMVQSVDSLHLAQELSKSAAALEKSLECLVEINIGEEQSKSGIDLAGAEELVYRTAEMPGLKVCGLMVIPPFDTNPDNTRVYFEKIHKLFIDIQSKKHDNSNIEMKYLSMGMSADYAQAIEEGSNMVRIGSALYGARVY